MATLMTSSHYLAFQVLLYIQVEFNDPVLGSRTDQRPTFHKVQEQLQLFRKFSLNSISQCRGEATSVGVINEGFEGRSLIFSELSFRRTEQGCKGWAHFEDILQCTGGRAMVSNHPHIK